MGKRIGLDMTTGSVFKKMLLYALPMMLSSALQQIYAVVDMIIVGQFVGSVGLSAVSVGSQAAGLVTTLCIGFSNGSQVLLSQHVGAKKMDDVNSIIGTTFSAHMIAAVVSAVPAIILAHPFLSLLKTPAESYAGTYQYLIISCLGIVFIFGYNMVASILRGLGDSTRPMVFIAIAAAINVALDLLFVGAFGMKAAGAALATVLSQAISFIIAVIYLYKRRDIFGFDFKLKSFAINKSILGKLLKIGIPQAIQFVAIDVSMLFITAQINAFGVAESAAFGAGQKIERIPSIVGFSLSGTLAVFVGQNFAADKYDRIKQATRVALVMSTTVFALFSALYLLFPRAMFSIFTSDPEVLDLAKTILYAMLLAYPANILMQSYRGVITGVGNASLNLAMGIIDGVVMRIGLATLFGSVMNMGLFGFVMGYAMATYGTAIPSFVYYLSGRWKKRKKLVDA